MVDDCVLIALWIQVEKKKTFHKHHINRQTQRMADRREYERNVKRLKELQDPSFSDPIPRDVQDALNNERDETISALLLNSFLDNAAAERDREIKRLAIAISNFEKDHPPVLPDPEPRPSSPSPSPSSASVAPLVVDSVLERMAANSHTSSHRNRDRDPFRDADSNADDKRDSRLKKKKKKKEGEGSSHSLSSLIRRAMPGGEKTVEGLNKKREDAVKELERLSKKRDDLIRLIEQIDTDLSTLLNPPSPPRSFSFDRPSPSPLSFATTDMVDLTDEPERPPRSLGYNPEPEPFFSRVVVPQPERRSVFVPEDLPVSSTNSVLSRSDFAVDISEDVLRDPARLQEEIERRTTEANERFERRLHAVEDLSLREEQERQYQESMRIDREKKEAERLEEERAENERKEKIRRMEELERKRQEDERIEQEKAQQRESQRLYHISLLASLPPERPSSDPLCFTAGLTLPSSRIRRRFLKSQPLSDIKVWACAELANDPDHFLFPDEFDLVASSVVLSDLSLDIGSAFPSTKGTTINIQSR